MRKQEGASLAHIIVYFLSRTYNKISSINIIQINHHPDAEIFQFFYPDVYLQLNMFWEFSRPSSGA
jgi:hypothetical protein